MAERIEYRIAQILDSDGSTYFKIICIVYQDKEIKEILLERLLGIGSLEEVKYKIKEANKLPVIDLTQICTKHCNNYRNEVCRISVDWPINRVSHCSAFDVKEGSFNE